MANISRYRAAHRRACFSIGIVFLLSLILAGCGSVKLHSETRQAQGEQAKKAWGEVKLDAYFAAERENLAKLLAEEIESTRRLAAINRESEVRVIATKPVVELPCYFQVELVKLVPPPDPPAGTSRPLNRCKATVYYTDAEVETWNRTFIRAWTNLRGHQRTLREIERAASFLQAMGVPAFTCPQLLANPSTAVDAWKKAHDRLAQDAGGRIRTLAHLCTQANTQRAGYLEAVQTVGSGDFKSYVEDWKRADEALKRRQAAVAEAQGRYAQAKKHFDEEVASANPGKSQVDKAKELAPKLAEILSGIESAQSVAGKEWASQERVQRLNDLLANLETGGDFSSETASKAELAVAMLPTIADDVRSIGQARRGAGLVSLLIQRDIEQGNLNAAKVLAAIQQKDLALREAIVEAALEQGITYFKAVRQSTLVVACGNEEEVGPLQKCKQAQGADGKNHLHQAWNIYDPAARKHLLESTTLYLDAFARQQVRLHTMATQYLALAREQTLAVSEVHASMWADLIGASVDQAADYAALGLKAEHFEKLLHLVGVFYIGHGVNK